MFKNIATKIIALFVAFSLLIIVIPFNNIKADSQTYAILDRSTSTNHISFTWRSNNTNLYMYVCKSSSSDNSTEIRSVAIYYINGNNISYQVYAAYNYDLYNFSSQSFVVGNADSISNYQNQSGNTWNISENYIYNNVNYKIGRSNPTSRTSAYVIESNSSMPFINAEETRGYTQAQLNEYVMGLLYGNSEPVINYGDLKVGYSTEFVSSGTSTDRFNKDIITWDNYDSNGNLLNDLDYTIELRAIPGYYTDVSQTQLLNQTIYNWIQGYVVKITNGAIDLEPFEYYTLGRWSPNKKQVEFTWGEVVDHFDMIDGHVGFILNEQWYKAGWRYEIRYIKGDISDPEYTSDWQTIYQVTAVAPSTSDNILNSYGNGLSPELYNLLQTVNTLNNTVQNWNINGVPINMNQNQQVTPDNSWIEKLIEGITSLLGSLIDGLSAIVQAIIGLGGDIIEGLFSIISDSISAIIEFFTNIWDGFLDLIENINFTDDNEIYDLDIPDYEGLLDVVPAFLRGLSSAGLSYMIWIPLVLGIIFIVL